jgi:hypothetical protein
VRRALFRNENLSLLSTYGPNAWLIRNYQLESQAKEVEAEVEVWKEKVVEVNRKRRVFQVSFEMRLWSVADETGCDVTKRRGAT